MPAESTDCTRLLLRSSAYRFGEEPKHRSLALRLVVRTGTQLHVDLTVGNAYSRLDTYPARCNVCKGAVSCTLISEATKCACGVRNLAMLREDRPLLRTTHRVTANATRIIGETIAYANTGCTCSNRNGCTRGYASNQQRAHANTGGTE